MKNYFVIIIGTLCFITLTLFTFRGVGIDSKPTKRFLYYYPNGLVANTDFDNTHMIGINIKEEKDIPAINFNFKDETNLESLLLFKYKTVFDFAPHILASLIFLISSFWFLLKYGDIYLFWFLLKYGDIYLFLFFIDISILIYSNFVLLAFDAYYFWFYLTLYLAGFLIIQMGFRLKGRDISIRWLLPEISFAVIVAFIGTSEKFDPVIFEKLTNFAIYIILFGTTGCISVLIYDNIKYELPFNSKFKKFVLAFAISLLVLIPYLNRFILVHRLLLFIFLLHLYYCMQFLSVFLII